VSHSWLWLQLASLGGEESPSSDPNRRMSRNEYRTVSNTLTTSVQASRDELCGPHSSLGGPSWRLLRALAMLGRSVVEGVEPSRALVIFPSLLTTKSRLPKWMAVPGIQTAPLSLLTIQSLDNFFVERASPLPSVPTVGVSTLAAKIKFIVRTLGSGRCVRWAQDLY
jgi:hypothetical protein